MSEKVPLRMRGGFEPRMRHRLVRHNLASRLVAESSSFSRFSAPDAQHPFRQQELHNGCEPRPGFYCKGIQNSWTTRPSPDSAGAQTA